jgi:hypothetical protein
MTTAGWQEGYDVPPRAGGAYRGRTGGSFDIVAFINRVADQYERDNGMRVERSARDTLIRSALPHVEQIVRELETGIITIEFLEESVLDVLRRAHDIRGRGIVGGGRLDHSAVEDSMRQSCPYLFLC